MLLIARAWELFLEVREGRPRLRKNNVHCNCCVLVQRSEVCHSTIGDVGGVCEAVDLGVSPHLPRVVVAPRSGWLVMKGGSSCQSLQTVANFSGTGSSQVFPSFQSFWRRILSLTTAGANHPSRSKILATSEAICLFVGPVRGVITGVATCNVSLPVSQCMPRAFWQSPGVEISCMAYFFWSSSGMVISRSVEFILHFSTCTASCKLSVATG